MKEQLTHILDQSVCLSRKQMKEYLSGSMLPEEMHAAEVHISSCPLCSMAMDGFQEHNEDALAAIASLNSGFLKEHFDNIAPQIHLNSMAPAAALGGAQRRSANGAWVRPVAVAALLLLVCATAWYLATQSNNAISVSHDFASANAPAQSPGSGASDGSNAAATTNALPSSKVAGSATLATDPHRVASTGHEAPKSGSSTPDRAAMAAASTGQSHNDATYGYQPELMTPEEAAAVAKTPKTILPSANDPAKTYPGDIVARQQQMYVPPAEPGTTESRPPVVSMRPTASPKPPAPESRPAMKQAAPVSSTPATDAAEPKSAKRSDESSDQLFERGEYRSALTKYRQQIRGAADADARNYASLQAARCYAALGESARAEELLRKVVDQGNGRDRRAAKRLLRNLR